MPNHSPVSHPSGTTFYSEGSQGEKKGNLGKPLAHDLGLGEEIVHLRSFCYLPCFLLFFFFNKNLFGERLEVWL